jgi:NAD(P)-dependent dehydrogenase (short-subunit alcohol dehydrogenase family)
MRKWQLGKLRSVLMSTSHPRTALLTGATGAIGRAIAAGLAATADVTLIVTGRDPVRLEALVAALCHEAGHERIRGELVDLCSHESIRALGRRLTGPLDLLLNNAAVAPPHRRETAEGIELVFATNVLGYVWMTESLRPSLNLGRESRVVNVASYWAGDLDLEDLEFRRRPYDNDAAYRQSKQANRMLTVDWAARLKGDGISVNCCHPGDVPSRLSHDLGFGGSESPAEGATTPLWLAVSEDVMGTTGCYFEHGRLAPCRFSQDEASVEQLARICDAYP